MSSEGKPTSFEADVYRVTTTIPSGSVAGYGWIVRQLGHGSARAVGRALGKNPCAPAVPCHRVIRSDGSIGGFMGGTLPPRIHEKISLLHNEGVAFGSDGKLVDPQRLLRACEPAHNLRHGARREGEGEGEGEGEASASARASAGALGGLNDTVDPEADGEGRRDEEKEEEEVACLAAAFVADFAAAERFVEDFLAFAVVEVIRRGHDGAAFFLLLADLAGSLDDELLDFADLRAELMLGGGNPAHVRVGMAGKPRSVEVHAAGYDLE